MSLKGVLPEVYNALFEHSGFQKLNAFLDIHCPHDPDTYEIREMYGERALSELTPSILKDTIHPLWRKPIAFDSLSMAMQQALLDPDLHDVIRQAEPGYHFDPEKPTLGDIARVPIIQQIALLEQIGHAKAQKFAACIDTLNDEKVFKKVVSATERICPDLVSHLSQKHYKFRLDIEPKNIVKNTASTWRKADDYKPTPNNEGKGGTLGVQDGLRLRLIPANSDEDFTFQQHKAMRDQLMAYLITGNGPEGFTPTRIKDNVSNTIQNGGESFVFPSCNINGLQDHTFALKNNESVAATFVCEIQFVPINKKTQHYVATTLQSRGDERVGNGTEMARELQLHEMWTKMPHLYAEAMRENAIIAQEQTSASITEQDKTLQNEIESQKRVQRKKRIDPSYYITEQYIEQTQYSAENKKKLSKRKGKGYSPLKVLNLSESNDLTELAKNEANRVVLNEMIEPYSAAVIEAYRRKKIRQYAAETLAATDMTGTPPPVLRPASPWSLDH